MKKYTYSLLVLFIITSLALTNCSKDDEVKKVTPSMTATIDGTAWDAKSDLSAYFQKSNSYLRLDGGQTIDMTIFATTTGTYQLTDSGIGSWARYSHPERDKISGATIPRQYYTKSNSGQIIITEYTSSVIKGTFNFEAYSPESLTFGAADTVKVENGVFTLEYTTQ